MSLVFRSTHNLLFPFHFDRDKKCSFRHFTCPHLPIVKLAALPSFTQVNTHGLEEPSWYHPHTSLATSVHQQYPTTSSAYPETPYHTGLKTPSPEQPVHKRQDSVQQDVHARFQHPNNIPFTTYDSTSGTYASMNQTQSYMDVGHGHMSHSSVSSAASQPPHYPGYQQHTPIQNGVSPYGSSPVTYSAYGAYGNGMPSLPHVGSSGHMGNQMVGQPPMSLPSEFHSAIV